MAIESLSVYLKECLVGEIILLPGERSLFTFHDPYVRDQERPVLSQSYLSSSGDLLLEQRPTQVRLSPWFSNLLPEGRLRDYLAQKGGVNPKREFQLLKLLGEDLPGAVRVVSTGTQEKVTQSITPPETLLSSPDILRFSLAGVQLKFSAVREQHGGLTIPAVGIGGEWIVKLPSEIYPMVPENEAAMLTLAREVGIQVPDHFLLPLTNITGLPDLGFFSGSKALAVKRFDRQEGDRIHMEDFAQVFRVYPENKYEKVGLARMAEMIQIVMGDQDAQEFIARIVFTILTGNGDMHLKNWSLLYPDDKHPTLSPAYDLVSTIPYIPNDRLALNFLGERSFESITKDKFKKFAQKAFLSEYDTLETVDKIVHSVREHWPKIRQKSEISSAIAERIHDHIFKMNL
jgi:serine/threonine-protein kinase HipA